MISLDKGILEKRKTGYAVSILSMHTWLKKEYGRETIEFPYETKARQNPPRGFSLER